MLQDRLTKLGSISHKNAESIKVCDTPRHSFGIAGVLGHSGATVYPAVVKDGPYKEMELEAEHLDFLGSEVAARVYLFGAMPGGAGRIVLEQISGMRTNMLLWRAIKTLDQKVWSRQPKASWDWGGPEAFHSRFGFDIPEWTLEAECAIHGDPTMANTFFNGSSVRFIDPKAPQNGIPPFSSVDVGKIMQSWLGWERALYAFSGKTVSGDWDEFYTQKQEYPFHGFPELELRRASFWCMIHFLRIVHREGQSGLGWWAARNVRMLQTMIGMEDVNFGMGPRWDVGGDTASNVASLQVAGHNPS